MLFSPVGTSRLQRIQGAYIDESEIEKLTERVAQAGRARVPGGAARGGRGERSTTSAEPEFDPDEDPLLPDAIRLVAEMQTASTSMLQRRLRLGYTRAGRLIDMLERRGVISGYEGSKPRQVLVSETDLPRVLAALAERAGGAVPLRARKPTDVAFPEDMPEIGQTLRETRMRNRVDITEVEAGTKIRAKYLRALENEEWDLLPGPTFVKTFLRSYADYLGLDSRLLVEEYKQRFERPSTMELTPFAPRPGGRGPPRAAPAPVARPGPRRRVRARAGAGRALRARLVGRGGLRRRREPNTVEKPTATPSGGNGEQRERPARPTRVTLQIVPTGLVNVCLVDANGRALIDNRDLEHRRDHPPLPRPPLPRLLRQRQRADALRRPHDRRARPLDAGRLRAAPRAAPARAVRGAPADLLVSRAGILITGTEVLSGIIADRNGPWLSERLRERGVEVARDPRRRRPPGRHARRAAVHGRGLDLVVTSGGLGPTADDLTAEVVAGLHGAAAGARRGARGAHLAHPRAHAQPLAQPRRGRDPRQQPQAGARAGGRDGARAGRHRARARRAGDADGGRAAGPAARAAADVGDGGGDAGAGRAARARGHLRAADHAPVRHPGVRDRALAARDRGRRACRSSSSRSRPACAAARSRSPPCSSRRRRRSTTRSRPRSASATATRCSPTTARPSTTR